MMRTVRNAVSKTVIVASTLFALIPAALAAEKVRIGLSSNGLLFMPALVADAMGYFRDEGLEVDLVQLGGANKVYTALIAGELEMSVSSSVSMLKAHSSGADIAIVGAAMDQHGSNIVATKEWAAKFNLTDASNYRERLKALKGITIGATSVGGGSDQLVRLLAEDAGLNAERDMTVTVLAVGDATLAAFARRRVDAIAHSSPVAVKAIRDHGGVMLFHLSAGGVPAYDGLLYLAYAARQAWLDKNPAAALKTLRALDRAHRAIRDVEQRDAIRGAVRAKFHTSIDAPLYADSWADYVNAFPSAIDINQAMIDRVVALSEKLESGDPIKPQSIRSAWTNRYVEAARQAN